jgi:hypothetical protein
LERGSFLKEYYDKTASFDDYDFNITGEYCAHIGCVAALAGSVFYRRRFMGLACRAYEDALLRVSDEDITMWTLVRTSIALAYIKTMQIDRAVAACREVLDKEGVPEPVRIDATLRICMAHYETERFQDATPKTSEVADELRRQLALLPYGLESKSIANANVFLEKFV